ncbi:MAG: 2-amino-4-hydroxy-6-hydroxymethyldihydropteridine diphosphokinase [Pseudanabaenaceae cyanobacterium SKYGB_i_bin29]|nr:2-amino-4-hydroxy-6-hydroxymethyldihydropteridine diphosphokinase [Pseudanabaenaceae cyanobacterium SKYG29]MDW8422678.1 2-amino-4-hydroxy-6-hydroxymethyldihydropteridine diphosphokinase [Pseudanabaenaceae cyanobacterium SKYGB_i_bin29]
MVKRNKVRCAIALGSNLGDSLAIVNQAVCTLQREVAITAVSRWYKTKPIGYQNGKPVIVDQPDFINGCVVGTTCLSAAELLEFLLQVEQSFGRVRTADKGARTLDLDLLFYGDAIINTPTLQVPHPRMTDRGFVLFPLAEIAPDWWHPVAKRSVLHLAQSLSHPLCAPIPYGNLPTQCQ